MDYILNQLRTGKSPYPFSLTDSDFNHDLLAALQALSTLTAETSYRVFSVSVIVLSPLTEIPNDWNEAEWLRAALNNPAFGYLRDPEEDIYTISDGKPFYEV